MPFVKDRLRKIHADSAEVLHKRLPKRFKQDASQYAYLQLRGGLLGQILEALYDSGRMPIPERHTHATVIVQAAPTIGS